MKGIEEGRFIVFEGIDGSGKDTISQQVFNELSDGYGLEDELYYLSMDKGANYKDIKTLISSNDFTLREVATLNIRNMESLNKIIVDKLNIDMFIIGNRWYYSTLAYNTITKEDEEYVYELAKKLAVPHMVIYLDLEPELALERISQNRNKITYWENLDMLKRAREKYINMMDVNNNIKLVDASMCLDDVFDVTMEIVKNIL